MCKYKEVKLAQFAETSDDQVVSGACQGANCCKITNWQHWPAKWPAKSGLVNFNRGVQDSLVASFDRKFPRGSLQYGIGVLEYCIGNWKLQKHLFMQSIWHHLHCRYPIWIQEKLASDDLWLFVKIYWADPIQYTILMLGYIVSTGFWLLVNFQFECSWPNLGYLDSDDL